MKCKQVQELAGAYLFGDLAPHEMKAVRSHAQHCHTCREDIRSRGAVAASIPNDAPTLSDEERQRIMWSVKGAIKAKRPSTSFFSFRFSPAYAIAGVAILAVIGVRYLGPPPHVHSSAPKATVRVTEEQRAQPPKEENVTASSEKPVAPTVATTHERRRFKIDVGAMMNRRPVVGVISRENHKRRDKIVEPEPPAPVVDKTPAPDVKESGDTKLPDPNESKNVETKPSEPAAPANTGGENSTSKP